MMMMFMRPRRRHRSHLIFTMTHLSYWCRIPHAREVPYPTIALEPAPWVPVPLGLIAPCLQFLPEENAHTLVLAFLRGGAPHPDEPLARWLRLLFPGLQ